MSTVIYLSNGKTLRTEERAQDVAARMSKEDPLAVSTTGDDTIYVPRANVISIRQEPRSVYEK